MKLARLLVAIVVAGALLADSAAAWDPYEWSDWWWPEEPVGVEPAWMEPAWMEPAWLEPTWLEPGWEPAAVEPLAEPPAVAAEPPAAVAEPPVPEGLYLVNEIYVADVVTTSGPVTTYATETSFETPGTYARVLETVGTGEGSALDGAAFNGRAALSDGRSVGGTYYENFVRTDAGFIPVSVVFFQDDREVASAPPPLAPASAPPAQAPIASVTPRIEAPAAPLPPAVAAPQPQDEPMSAVPQPDLPPPPAPAAPRIIVGLAPTPDGLVRQQLEVIRGRRITLWARATVDGAAVAVRGWRVVSGELTVLGPLAGPGEVPLVARWDRVTGPRGEWPLLVEVTIDLAGKTVSVAEIAVAVRAPALVE